jgi:hypothetical protein
MQDPYRRGRDKKRPIWLLICFSFLTLGFLIFVFASSGGAFFRRHSAPLLHPSNQEEQARSADASSIPQMLKQINSTLDPGHTYLLNAEHAKLLAKTLRDSAQPMDTPQGVMMETIYADELLKAGKTEEALREYHLVQSQVEAGAPPTFKQGAEKYLWMQEAIGYMRLGEQQNCCASNNSYSCLLPISGTGVHTKQYGSRQAIVCLTRLLKAYPDSLQPRWLLNIAYMTLGEYPRNVPPQWLIPLKVFGGEHPMKKFYNAAPLMGLDLLGWAGSVIMEDFEGNGRLDLMISSQRPDGQLRYFRNNGDGTFTERTRQSGLTGEVSGLNLITTDYNNDGRPDVIVLRGGWNAGSTRYPLSLLRNDGGGRFTDYSGPICQDSERTFFKEDCLFPFLCF